MKGLLVSAMVVLVFRYLRIRGAGKTSTAADQEVEQDYQANKAKLVEQFIGKGSTGHV